MLQAPLLCVRGATQTLCTELLLPITLSCPPPCASMGARTTTRATREAGGAERKRRPSPIACEHDPFPAGVMCDREGRAVQLPFPLQRECNGRGKGVRMPHPYVLPLRKPGDAGGDLPRAVPLPTTPVCQLRAPPALPLPLGCTRTSLRRGSETARWRNPVKGEVAREPGGGEVENPPNRGQM